ncbi:MAG TPA: hypothetical protein VHM91_14190, partial [Verrucomicrobiales bacterium]|nr:hypothetical protein [Verrucomicrobiales bacterium]
KGGMTVADLIIDDNLGPTKPNVISTVGDSSKALNYTLDVMQEIKRLGAATKTVAKKAGGVISVTGYYFDLSEVKLARANLKAIQDAMAKAQAENASLTKQLEVEIAKMQKAEQIMTSGIKPARRKAEAKAWERDRMITAAGYSLSKAFPWKIAVDLNRVTPWR